MPASFNVLEAFVEYHPDRGYFSLREEQDHLVSFLDFLDYATSPDSPTDISSSASLLKEGVIYSFNALNDPGEITFSVRPGVEYGIGGFAVVRHSEELSVLLLAGERTDTAQKTQELKQDPAFLGKPAPGREGIAPAEDLTREAVQLLGNADFWQVIVLARYDLSDRTEDARYLLKDAGDSFIILTDDVDVFLDDTTGEFLDPKYEAYAKKLATQIDEYATLFELCKTCLQLPSYFDHSAEAVRVERHSTKFFESVKRGKWRTRRKLLTTNDRVTYRNVLILQGGSDLTANSTLYRAPEFRVQVLGYWKTLSLQESGEDKHGNQIHGRTWVRKELSWIQRRDELVVRAERSMSSNETVAKETPESQAGYIYVMHNPAHEKDIFKVGLTRRNSDLRSEELSGTGSPDKFLVAHEWKVVDCVQAEKAIHQALDSYRINPKREFFRLPYQELIAIISSVVELVVAELDC